MKDFFIRRPIFSIVLSIVIVILGVLSILNLSIQQYPDITPPTINVSASYRGADALSVEQSVATPIAQSIMGVDNLLYLQTTSSADGNMSLEATFDISSDQNMDAIFTQNNVATATPMLPNSVKTQGVITQKSMTGFLMVFSLFSDGRYGDTFLANYAMINLKNELLKINGVGNVEIMGAGEYSMRIWVNPDKMKYYGVTASDIIAAVESQSGVTPVGKLGTEPSERKPVFTYNITMPPQIDTPEAYAEIVLSTGQTGGVVRLKDVARVEFSAEQFSVSSAFDGKPCAIMVVYQTPGSNAVAVGGSLLAKMEQLKNRFPDGVSYETVVNGVTPITSGIREILMTLCIALLLVILVIFVFIQELRSTAIALIAIPVSLIGAFMLFPLFGFSLNIISLLGIILAVGLVVDDAIVVVEAVQSQLEQGKKPFDATVSAMRLVAAPIISTTVVLIAVFVPVSFISGITGLLYQQFSITIALSVVISAFNSLTLTPALSALLLRNKPKSTTGFFGVFNRGFSNAMSRYENTLGTVENHRKIAFSLLAAIGVATFLLAKTTQNGFLPEEDQGYIMVAVDLPEAAALNRTEKVVQKVEEIVLATEGVKYCATASGFNLLSGTNTTSCGILFVTLDDFDKRTVSSFEIADRLNGELYVALSDAQAFAFGPPAIPGLGTASGLTLFVQDFSSSGLKNLSFNTFGLIDSLKKDPAIASVTTQFNDGIPARKLTIDNELALMKGVSIEELHRLVATYLGGTYINNFNRFGKLYETYIQAEADYRFAKEDINRFFIENSQGESVPVSTFVTITDTTSVEYLTQFNLYPAIGLNVSAAPGVSSSSAMDAVERIASTTLPNDMGIAWSGTSYQEKNASSSVLVYLLALVFVYLTLTALYNNWVIPLSILFGVPLALFGAFLFIRVAGLFDAKYIDNVFVQISLVMLIGLSAKNAILIVEYAQIEFFEKGKSLRQAAIAAARMRVRPILMTAFAFVFGVMPLIFASGVYSTARNVMGVALVGGMGVATILGLFIYPSLYVIAGEISRLTEKREKEKSINS